MNLLIITGMSGAGKTQAIKKLEDIDWFCVDNLPIELIEGLLSLLGQTNLASKVALGLDIRTKIDYNSLTEVINKLELNNVNVDILFLDASDETLVRRFSETRRAHPLSKEGLVKEGIDAERLMLDKIRQHAKYYIDTSNLKPAQLGEALENLDGIGKEKTLIVVSSFGFKNKIPNDADMIFDVRFAPNPFWIAELKNLSGMDKPVFNYVLDFPQVAVFVNDFVDMSAKLVKYYAQEGKHRLHIAFGCTGGRHRSVAIAQEVSRRFVQMGLSCITNHRDIDRDVKV